MNKRLAQFIEYKTGGNQKEFAKLIGWSPQYLYKMLKGDSMGIQPVISLLMKFKELDARWLILGEGVMLDTLRNRIIGMLALERYIPVMTKEQVGELASGRTDFGSDTVEEWEELLWQRKHKIRQRFKAAYKRQDEYAESGRQPGSGGENS